MFMMVCIMMFSKTIGNFFALLSMQWDFFAFFNQESKNTAYSFHVSAVAWSYCWKFQNMFYCPLIIVQWAVGGPIILNCFVKWWRIFPLQSTPQFLLLLQRFKTLQFTCTGIFRCSHAHSEGMIHRKKYPAEQLRACGSVRYNASSLEHKIVSEARNRMTGFGWVSM